MAKKTKRRKIVGVRDRMQRFYRYELSAPIGKKFDPEFRPELPPAPGAAALGLRQPEDLSAVYFR